MLQEGQPFTRQFEIALGSFLIRFSAAKILKNENWIIREYAYLS